MLKTRLLSCVSTLIFSFFTILAFGQLAIPCPSNTQPPADNCGDCIYCNFNGMQSTTAGYNPSPAPGFGGSIENNQWLGFMASENKVTFTAIPNNCTNGDGLQLAVYNGTCDTIIGYYGGVAEGATVPATISMGDGVFRELVPGQTYYLMIDGFAGDQCSFTIAVSPNSALVPTFPAPADSITGPTKVCPSTTVQYCTPSLNGVSAYVWNAPPGALINGVPGPVTLSGNAGLCVDITWPPNATAGPILVNGINSCFTNTPPAVLVANSIPLAPTIVQLTDVCFPYTLAWGTVVNEPGAYSHVYQVSAGCDSMVTHIISSIIVPPTILPPATICQGDSVEYCNESFATSGSFEAVCTNVNGCDSIVNVILIVIDVDPTILGGGTLSCNNPTTTLYATPGPAIHSWFSENGAPLGLGDSLVVNATGVYILESAAPTGTTTNCVLYDTITISGNLTPPNVTTTNATIECGQTAELCVGTNLSNVQYAWSLGTTPSNTNCVSVSSPGNYGVTVTDVVSGCTNAANAEVIGSPDIPIVNLTGGNLPCMQSTVELVASSPLSGVSFLWSNGETSPSISVSAPGTYTVTVTDPSNGCTNAQSYTVSVDSGISTNITGGDLLLSCINPSVSLIAGSSMPATYVWSTGETTDSIIVTNPGIYSLTTTDQNGCTALGSVEVTLDNMPPVLTLPQPLHINCCISEVVLALETTPSMGLTYAWSGGNLTSMEQQPTVSEAGTYSVIVTNPSNGCTAMSTLTVDSNTNEPDLQAEGGILTCAMPIISLSANSTANVAYAWSGPNGFMSNIANPMVDSAGVYTIEIQDLTTCCVASQEVLVVDSCFVSVYALENKGQIRVYPNATTGQLFVESMTPELLITTVQVQALDGKILISDENLSTSIHELDLGLYAKGTYLVWAEVGGQRLLFKVSLQ